MVLWQLVFLLSCVRVQKLLSCPNRNEARKNKLFADFHGISHSLLGVVYGMFQWLDGLIVELPQGPLLEDVDHRYAIFFIIYVTFIVFAVADLRLNCCLMLADVADVKGQPCRMKQS